MGTTSLPDVAVFETQGAMSCGLLRLADSYQNAGFFQGSIVSTGYIFVAALKPDALAACP
jgi:hypothetical protein